MISRITKLIVLIAIILAIAYLGACVYANWFDKKIQSYEVPPIPEAQYQFIIRNTGNVLFTDNYEINGSLIKVNGFWALIDGKFEYRDKELILDKEVFGEIIIRSR